MIDEIRVYVPHEGKGDALRERFLGKVRPVFARLGIDLVGTYMDAETPDRMVYITRFETMAQRDALWAAFKSDPEWLSIKAASETDGPLLKEQKITLLNPVG